MHTGPRMKPVGELAVDVLILASVTSYTVVALFYIARMWHLRKQFFVALR